MNSKPEKHSSNEASKFTQTIDSKVKRKLIAKRKRHPGIWFGLGMMGLIGWSIAIPALLGVILGLWLDRVYAANYSWTLALLVAGLMIGCWNAWHWIAREYREMEEDRHNGDD